MIPEPEGNPASELSPSTPARPRRRSRRGGRRRSRPPRPRDSAPAYDSPTTGALPPADYDVAEAEPFATPAPATAARPAIPPTAAVSQAIEQVNQVIEELKRALDEMEEVLETLELAERQKIEDEREIESLQRSLRRLHRPGPPPRS